MRILKKTNSILLNKSEKLNIKEDDVKMLAGVLLKAWESNGKQRGISLPQVGVNRCMILCRINGEAVVMVNPKITFKFGVQISNEGCLSVEGRYYVWRPRLGCVKYYDLEGKVCRRYCNRDLIRTVCHECDHLRGICIDDRGWRVR